MERRVRYSTSLLAAVLWPALLLTGDCDRATGDTSLSLLEVETSGQNQVLGFASNDRTYDIWTLAGTNTAVLRAQPNDPSAQVTWQLGVDSGSLGTGGGEVTLDLSDGPSTISVTVRPSGGAVGIHTVHVNPMCGTGGECDDGNECTVDTACDVGTGLCPPPTLVAAQTACDAGSIEDKICDGAGACVPTGSQEWGVPSLLETNSGDARYPRVAVDAAGNAIAVWQQPGLDILGFRSIWASRFTPATGWGPPEVLEIDDGTADSPQVAMDASGNAIAIWQQSDGTRTNLWANHYTLGVGWGGATLVEVDDSGDARLPSGLSGPTQSIGIDSGGNAMVFWLLVAPEPPTVGNDLIYSGMASRYTPGGGWGAPVQLSANALDLQIGVAAAGNAIAVWRGRPSFGGATAVVANRFTPGSGWDEFAFNISRNHSGAQWGPRMAMDAAGNTLVAWSGCTDFCDDVLVNRYSVSFGWWEGVQVLFSDSVAVSYTPAVAINDAGDALVAWRQSDIYPNTSLWAQRYSQGAWQGAEGVHPGPGDDPGPFGDPSAAIDAAGNAIVAWGARFVDQAVPSVPDLFASRYVVGMGWEAAMVIEANGVLGNALFPEVKYGADGGAMLVWADGHSAFDRDIVAIRFHP